MKKIIGAVLSTVMALSCAETIFARTMYAPDGRTAEVEESEVASWQSVGWYDYPVLMIYSPEGVSFPIAQRDTWDWIGYGWYDYPVTRVYAPDGRKEVIATSAVEAWKAVGWYDYPVTRVYAPDGRSEVIATSAVDDWVKVGWEDPNRVNESVRNFEKEVVRLVNVARAEYGLLPLSEDENLSKIARIKSEDMRDNKYFSHTSPTYGSPFDMMAQFGVSYRSAGENIAYGYTTPAAVVEGWLNSPGHRANILSESFEVIGVGYAPNGNYWTQMFIG